MILNNKTERDLEDEQQIILKNVFIDNVTEHKHLRLTFHDNSKWSSHIGNLFEDCSKRLELMRIMRILMFKAKSSLEKIYMFQN